MLNNGKDIKKKIIACYYLTVFSFDKYLIKSKPTWRGREKLSQQVSSHFDKILINNPVPMADLSSLLAPVQWQASQLQPSPK